MYRMKPLFEVDKVEVETPMYRIRGIHDSGNAVPMCNGTAEDDNVYVKFIEGRQQDILMRLKELKSLLSAPIALSEPSPKIERVPSSIPKMCPSTVDFVKHGITQDVVLNTNPGHLPYSLLGLLKLWKGRMSVKLSCHTHSTVRSLPKAAAEFQEKLLASLPSPDVLPVLSIRLVWKNVEADSVFVISPIKSVSVYGEVNFLRFLNACLVGELDLVEQTVLDDKLDSCYFLSVEGNKNLPPHVQNVLSNLNNSSWLTGSQPSVLDLAAWSVIRRQSKSIALDQKGKTWFEKADKLFSS